MTVTTVTELLLSYLIITSYNHVTDLPIVCSVFIRIQCDNLLASYSCINGEIVKTIKSTFLSSLFSIVCN